MGSVSRRVIGILSSVEARWDLSVVTSGCRVDPLSRWRLWAPPYGLHAICEWPPHAGDVLAEGGTARNTSPSGELRGIGEGLSKARRAGPPGGPDEVMGSGAGALLSAGSLSVRRKASGDILGLWAEGSPAEASEASSSRAFWDPAGERRPPEGPWRAACAARTVQEAP